MAKKWNCPTCRAPNIPKGSHCRACICDILSGSPIGTTARLMREERRAGLNIAEMYEGGVYGNDQI